MVSTTNGVRVNAGNTALLCAMDTCRLNMFHYAHDVKISPSKMASTSASAAVEEMID